MTNPATIMVVFGTRPEAIKLFPVVNALKADPRFRCVVCVSAQHREMLDQVLEIAGIVPDHDLDVMKPDQSLDELTARLLTGLGKVMDAEQPARVIVQGDTATAMCGALAAYYRKDRHVEWQQTFSPALVEPRQTTTETTGSLALEDTHTFGEALDVVLGVSYDWRDLNRAEDFNAGQFVYYPLTDDDAWNWQAAARWQVSDAASLHASVSTQVQVPGDAAVVLFVRHHAAGTLVQVYNVSEGERRVPLWDLAREGITRPFDELTGRPARVRDEFVVLEPYAACWFSQQVAD